MLDILWFLFKLGLLLSFGLPFIALGLYYIILLVSLVINIPIWIIEKKRKNRNGRK